jgi:hypothetical protein
MDDNTNWITVTEDVLNNLDFEVEEFYKKCDDQISAKEIRDKISEKMLEMQKQNEIEAKAKVKTKQVTKTDGDE